MINKTFRLFISSTFSDFLLERRILNDEIYPVIDEFCQKQGYNFQLIDLRWGVNNESALNQNTLAICLDEVRRCKTLSPKPNFLLMAGERYGWIPLPAAIGNLDFMALLSVAEANEKALLQEWYTLDENEIGNTYFLKKRKSKYIDEAVWARTEKELHQTLFACTKRTPNCSVSLIESLLSSATEQEILEGLLNNADTCDNTIAIFRSNYPHKDPDQTKIQELKSRISQKLELGGCKQNLVELLWTDRYAAEFKEHTISLLKNNIRRQIECLNIERTSGVANNPIEEILGEGMLIERENEQRCISQYVRNTIREPLFVVGDSGSGKTTILAEYISNSNDQVFYMFYGLDENSYTLIDGLRVLIAKVREVYGITQTIDLDSSNVTECIYQLIYLIPSQKKTVIVIDGLDMYHDIDEIRESIFPTTLPAHIKMVISVATGHVADRFLPHNVQPLIIDHFSCEESHKNLNLLLKQKNRCIANDYQKEVVANALRNGGTPLQLKMLAEICSRWHSSDNEISLSEFTDSIALQYLQEMYTNLGHNKELVLCALSLVASSPYGITEEELQSLLLRFPSVKAYFVSEDRYNHDLVKLPFVVWSRLFYDLKGCLLLTKSSGFIVVKFAHQVFHRAFSKHYTEYCNTASSILIDYYSSQCNYVQGSEHPNIRKVLCLPHLLKVTANYQALAASLSDMSYLDATIRAGRVDEAISNIFYLLDNKLSEQKEKTLIQLYRCLQNHREMLSCYRNGFYFCAEESGIKRNKHLFVRQENRHKGDSPHYFPYSCAARIVWNEQAGRYAVFQNSYIYICDSTTGAEQCRIYLEPEPSGKHITVRDLIWVSGTHLVALTSGKELFLYDIQDTAPNLVAKITHSEESDACVRYSEKYHLLFFQREKAIHAITIPACEPVFTIPIKSAGSLGFDVFEDQLILKDQIKYIKCYSLPDGKLTKKVSVKSKPSYFELYKRIGGYGIHKISDDIWFEYHPTSLVIYNTGKHKKLYMHPPFYRLDDAWLVGRKYFIYHQTDTIISIDMSNGGIIRRYTLAGIKSTAWKTVDQTLIAVTNTGLHIIDLSSFDAFSECLPCCMFFSKNLFESLQLMVKPLIKGSARLLYPLVNVLNNWKNMLNYAVLFSEAMHASDLKLFKDSDGDRLASIIITAKDGKKAVVFENNSSIIFYDPSGKPLYEIDKLKLAIDNNIIKLDFSPDSKHFFIWCNRNVTVIDLMCGRLTISVDLSKRPALDVWIDEEGSAIGILLSDKNVYRIRFSYAKEDLKGLPSKSPLQLNGIEIWGVYNIYPAKEGINVYPMLNETDFLASFDHTDGIRTPYRWFNDMRMYYSTSKWLLYSNGFFYLDGDLSKPFKQDFVDFKKCRQLEHLQISTPLDSYLREKNDLFSELLEIGNRYLVLISRMLNSIVIFDMCSMSILFAYKTDGNIIGCTVDDTKTKLELYLDREPFRSVVTIDLPGGMQV